MISDIAIQFKYGSFLFSVIAIGLILFSVWSYRWTRPPIPTYQRVFLIILRSFSLIFLWMFLNQIALNWSKTVIKPYQVALLVDNSQSMAVDDQTGNRQEITTAVLSTLDELGKKQNFTLSEHTLTENNLKGSIDFDLPESNLEEAFYRLLNRNQNKPDEIILLSDGNFNEGNSPSKVIKDAMIPVHSMVIGDSSFSKDISIATILHPEKSYTGDDVSISATIRGVGVPRLETSVILRDQAGNEISREKIHFSRSDFSEVNVEFSFSPDIAGVNSWSVSVDNINDEFSLNNNSRSFIVDVLDRRKNVLVFTPEPSADAATLSMSLEDLDDYETTVFVGAGKKNQLLRGTWSETKNSFDAAIVFLDGRWNNSELKWFEEFLQNQYPTLYVIGRNHNREILDRLENYNFRVKGRTNNDEVKVIPAVQHPIFTEERQWIGGSQVSIPPLEISNLMLRNGEVLAFAEDGNDRIPVLTVQSNSPRVLFLTASGLYKWRMYSHNLDPEKREFDALVARIARWLTSEDDRDRIFIKSDKDLYSGMENVLLIASVYSESQIGIDDAEVSAEVTHSGQTFTYELSSKGDGTYYTQFDSWGNGKYTVNAQVNTGIEIFNRNDEFFVEEFSRELSDTRMRPEVFREIASVSGGGMFFPGEEERLLEQITPVEDKEVISRTWRPFGLRLTLLIIIATLCIEWFFRIRRGMV